MNKKFAVAAANESHVNWEKLIERVDPLYNRGDDPRKDFSRDYNRLLHCTAYRRLKHKTQVFFATENDHICTRIEHVNHVIAVSHTIAEELGLNIELTNAIAIGHDIGHAPFGHEGEKILDRLAKANLNESFWHERNSLWFVDNLETLANPENIQNNLALTYAVRDGIVCHCGEIDQNSISPRHEAIDLRTITKAAEFQPFTWEGCVVKTADKIAFLGRDIEDAFALKFLSPEEFAQGSRRIAPELAELLNRTSKVQLENITNTAIIHNFILDLCRSSNPEIGLKFSQEYIDLMKALKKVSYELIYNHPRLNHFKKLARLVLESIFEELSTVYRGEQTPEQLRGRSYYAPRLYGAFADWVIKYFDVNPEAKAAARYGNKLVYHLNKPEEYTRAIIDFISGMTDNFALEAFDELTKFR